MLKVFDRRDYWNKKILSWEEKRYGLGRMWRPSSWTISSRLALTSAVIRATIRPGCHLLELGCGSGYLACSLAGHYSSYFGFDWASSAIAAAKAKGLENCSFVEADVLNLNFPHTEATVFLGLIDWLSIEEFSQLLSRCNSPWIVFSYTRRAFFLHPYNIYRNLLDRTHDKNAYSARRLRHEEIENILLKNNFQITQTLRPVFFDPGRIVVARKNKIQ